MKNKDDIQKAVNFIVKNSTIEELELKNGAKVGYRVLNQENFIALVNEIIRLNKKCKENKKIEQIKCPLNKYTFKVKKIKNWVENNCEGKVLNLFAGVVKLSIDEIRNDLNKKAVADYYMDALDFIENWKGEKFNTILLDPPYTYRKSMEMYNGIIASPFRQLKDAIIDIIARRGIVITFGYHSVSMGENRGFKVEKIAIFSHGGAIHDTIATVERKIYTKRRQNEN